MFDVLGVTTLVLLATLSGWLALRVRRAQSPFVKWFGLVIASLVSLACTAAVGLTIVGFYRINFPPYQLAVADMKVAGTPDQVARGASFGAFCATCHSPDGKPPLVGRNLATDGPPMGTLWAANLTRAGEIEHWSDGEVIRAIREGVHKTGRALILMPSEIFRHLSDADVEAIVAYLRSQPAVEPNTPPTQLNVLVAFFIGLGLAPTSAQPPITRPIIAPPEGDSREHGEYLVSILGCRRCHGENLTGGTGGGPGSPPAPNLRVILAAWSVENFVRTLQTGIDPYNRTLAEGMPSKGISAIASDTGLKAIYQYIRGLPPIDDRTE